jgi:hypothetical protein
MEVDEGDQDVLLRHVARANARSTITTAFLTLLGSAALILAFFGFLFVFIWGKSAFDAIAAGLNGDVNGPLANNAIGGIANGSVVCPANYTIANVTRHTGGVTIGFACVPSVTPTPESTFTIQCNPNEAFFNVSVVNGSVTAGVCMVPLGNGTLPDINNGSTTCPPGHAAVGTTVEGSGLVLGPFCIAALQYVNPSNMSCPAGYVVAGEQLLSSGQLMTGVCIANVNGTNNASLVCPPGYVATAQTINAAGQSLYNLTCTLVLTTVNTNTTVCPTGYVVAGEQLLPSGQMVTGVCIANVNGTNNASLACPPGYVATAQTINAAGQSLYNLTCTLALTNVNVNTTVCPTGFFAAAQTVNRAGQAENVTCVLEFTPNSSSVANAFIAGTCPNSARVGVQDGVIIDGSAGNTLPANLSNFAMYVCTDTHPRIQAFPNAIGDNYIQFETYFDSDGQWHSSNSLAGVAGNAFLMEYLDGAMLMYFGTGTGAGNVITTFPNNLEMGLGTLTSWNFVNFAPPDSIDLAAEPVITIVPRGPGDGGIFFDAISSATGQNVIEASTSNFNVWALFKLNGELQVQFNPVVTAGTALVEPLRDAVRWIPYLANVTDLEAQTRLDSDLLIYGGQKAQPNITLYSMVFGGGVSYVPSVQIVSGSEGDSSIWFDGEERYDVGAISTSANFRPIEIRKAGDDLEINVYVATPVNQTLPGPIHIATFSGANGILNLDFGLTLPTSGGTPTPLTYYEEGNFVMPQTTTSPCNLTAQSNTNYTVNVSFVRVGKTVTLAIPFFQCTDHFTSNNPFFFASFSSIGVGRLAPSFTTSEWTMQAVSNNVLAIGAWAWGSGALSFLSNSNTPGNTCVALPCGPQDNSYITYRTA